MISLPFGYQHKKLFWNGSQELNIESPFKNIQKLLQNKGYILSPHYTWACGMDLSLKNI